MEKIVFTNGCFDLIHPGHIELLERAKKMGTKLIVGINSDKSVRKIKGKDRPFQGQDERKKILENLKPVDEVVIFDELTPENLIKKIKPDVLIKGGDWNVDEIIGADFVLNGGGEVLSLPLKNGYSSSKIAEKIRAGANHTENNLMSEKAQSSDNNLIENSLGQHIDVFKSILQSQTDVILECAEIIYQTIEIQLMMLQSKLNQPQLKWLTCPQQMSPKICRLSQQLVSFRCSQVSIWDLQGLQQIFLARLQLDGQTMADLMPL